MTIEQLIPFIIINFPIAAFIFYAQNHGWWYSAKAWQVKTEETEKQLKSKDDEIDRLKREKAEEAAFREQLRQEAIVDKRSVEEKLFQGTEALKDLTDVVRQQLEFTEQVVRDSIQRGPERPAQWDGSERRGKHSTRTKRRTQTHRGSNQDSQRGS